MQIITSPEVAHPAGLNFGANNHFPRSGAVWGQDRRWGQAVGWRRQDLGPLSEEVIHEVKGFWGSGANESLPQKVAQSGPGIIFGAKNNFQKVAQFGFILFSVLIYYRGVY